MVHIENLTVNMPSGLNSLSRAFIDALLRGPVGDEPTKDGPVKCVATPPHIGEYWHGQGGIYAGIARGRDGEPDYHLILCDQAPATGFKWQAALEFAKTIVADGHKDFAVPTRWESSLLFANLQDKLDTDNWHWTSTQSSESDAFFQLFNDGLQSYGSKDYERRCRFVRRLIL